MSEIEPAITNQEPLSPKLVISSTHHMINKFIQREDVSVAEKVGFTVMFAVPVGVLATGYALKEQLSNRFLPNDRV